MEPTADSIHKLIDELAGWQRDLNAVHLLWPCQHCGADVDQPCRKPDGSAYRLKHDPPDRQRFHAQRMDIGCRTYNSAGPLSWAADLGACAGPNGLRRLHSEICRSRLYKRLRKLGRLATKDCG